MDLSSIKAAQNALLYASSTSDNSLAEASASKSHISTAKGAQLNALAQQQNQEEITRGLSAEYGADTESYSEQPALRQTTTTTLTNKSQTLLAMLRYQSLTSTMDDSRLATAAAVFAAQSEAQITKAQELSAYLDNLQNDFDAQSEIIHSAQSAEDAANSVWKTAFDKLNSAQNVLDNLLNNPDASEEDIAKAQAEDIAKAQANVTQATQELREAAEKLSAAKNTTQAALDASQKILNEINAKTAEMNRQYSNTTFPATVSARTAVEQSEQALTRTAIMIKLITEFIMKMDEMTSNKLQSDLEINRMQSEARQAEMKSKSDEYEEQVRKAEEAQKMAGCIGKILGGLSIALGAITTIFGGAGVALMAVGIALMVADPIVEAITGESLTGMIMNPLMEHVFMPLMDVLGGIVSKIFDYTPLGLLLNAIDKATGANMMDTIHTAVTAAVAIAVIVAVAYLAKSAGKFLIDKMTQAMTSAIMQAIKKAITQVINKIIPQLVKSAARQGKAALSQASRTVAKQVSQTIDRVSKQVTKQITGVLKQSDSAVIRNLGKINLNHLNMARIGLDTSNLIVQAGMNINIGNIQSDASKALAAFHLANSDMRILRDLLDSIISRFKTDQEQVQSVRVMLSETLHSQAATGQFISRNMKA